MNPAAKLVGGALLVGVGFASGNAAILTVAGGIGINWTSEAVMELWHNRVPVPRPNSPLQHAYQRAIEKGVNELRAQYGKAYGMPADARAFELVAACAREL